MEICKREECCGCFACVNICPKQCIHMEPDTVGDIYPVIDESKCISCGACQRACLNNKALSLRKPKSVYRAWVKDNTARSESSSGGLGTALAETVLRKQGIVYGAALQQGCSVSHQAVTQVEDLSLLKKSKYVQSHIRHSYAEIRTLLRQDKEVLFIGTPCQVAGLYSFLGKEYPRLYTVDLICHGVPSQKILQQHVSTILKKLGKAPNTKYTLYFRDNNDFHLSLIDGSGKLLYKGDTNTDLYMKTFLNVETLRPSCYRCKFAQSSRVSDITIGDFWGIHLDGEEAEEIAKGISCVLVNTDKGTELLSQTGERLSLQERKLEEAVDGNGQLQFPAKFGEKAHMIRQYMLDGMTFNDAAYRVHRMEMYKYRIKEYIKAFDAKLPIPIIRRTVHFIKGK